MAKRKAAPDAGGHKKETSLAVIATPPPAVAQVFKWILEGQTEIDVRDAIAVKFPGEKADPLIIAAIKQFAAAGEFQPEIMLGWCDEAYREIYRRSMEAGDLAAALRAVRLRAQLAGFK